MSIDTTAQRCSAELSSRLVDFCKSTLPPEESNHRLQMIRELRDDLQPHVEALFQMAQGGASGVASDLLDGEITMEPESAAAWSDLSAALLLDADDLNDWQSLEAAIVAADTALNLDWNYERALFNRALALERLSLDEAADKDWSMYLALAPDDDWKEEASHRRGGAPDAAPGLPPVEFISQLSEMDEQSVAQLARDQPSRFRRLLERDSTLLAGVGSDIDSFCADGVESWVTVGRTIKAVFQDHLIFDSVNWLCRERPETAVEGARKLAAAIRLRGQSDFTSAMSVLVSARQLLAKSDGPLGDVALVLHASTMLSAQQYDEADALLQAHVERLSRTYPGLAAEALRILGTIKIRHADYESAVALFKLGLTQLSRGNDPELAVRLHSLTAEALALAGRPDDAWREGLGALRQSRRQMLPAEELSAACEFLAMVAAETEAYRLQELFADCSIEHLSRNAEPRIVTSAYIASAQAKTALGKQEEADADLRMAKTAATSVQDRTMRTRLLRHVELFDGLNKVADAPAESLVLLSGARDYFADHEVHAYEFLAGIGLVDAYTELEKLDYASREFDRLGRLAAQAQYSARRVDFHLPLQQHYRPIVNRSILLKLKAGDPMGGLQALLESRLSLSLNACQTERLIDKLAHRSGDQATLILAWLDGKIAGWLIDQGGLTTWFLNSLPDGQRLVERAIGIGTVPMVNGRVGAISRLYDALIAPVSTYLAEKRVLRIVPDGVLFGVPYPGLWDRGSEQYLIEEYRLLISPEFPRSDAASAAGLEIQSAALFGNTASGSARPLNAVDHETSDIAHILQSTASVQIFTDTEATRKSFLDALGHYDLVHFAGHGEVNIQHPLLSQLVLGSGRNEAQNIVSAADLYEYRPARMPALVVLAACDTAAYTKRLPHSVTMVRPILDIGAGEVLGSLRPIPDDAYKRLMVRFYKELVQTGNAAQALRRVQVHSAINASPGTPGYWAFIQIFSYL